MSSRRKEMMMTMKVFVRGLALTIWVSWRDHGSKERHKWGSERLEKMKNARIRQIDSEIYMGF